MRMQRILCSIHYISARGCIELPLAALEEIFCSMVLRFMPQIQQSTCYISVYNARKNKVRVVDARFEILFKEDISSRGLCTLKWQ